jgi:hypothetical protein
MDSHHRRRPVALDRTELGGVGRSCGVAGGWKIAGTSIIGMSLSANRYFSATKLFAEILCDRVALLVGKVELHGLTFDQRSVNA